MIKNLNFRNFIKSMINFIVVCLNYFLGKKRFFPISPPFIKNQKIYDKDSGRKINLTIETWEDFLTLKQIFYNEEYNLKRLRRYKDIKNLIYANKKNNIKNLIIDCGANIGLASKYFELSVINSKIISIEPERENFNLSKKNNSSNIIFLNCAVGSKDTWGNIIDPGLGSFAYRVTEKTSDSKDQIEIVSINKLLKEYSDGNTEPFLIKIDIEGFEKNLFQQDVEWIEKFPIIIIEIHDWMMPKQNISLNFLREISKHERDFILIGENIYSISNQI